MPSRTGSRAASHRFFPSPSATRSYHASSSRSSLLQSTTPTTQFKPFETQIQHEASFHQATTPKTASPISQFQSTPSEIPPTTDEIISWTSPTPTTDPANLSSSELTHPPPPSQPSKPLVLSKSLQQLLPSLQAQKQIYMTAHIHRFPYLVTEGDTIRLPFHMHGVQAGDILRLNRASIIGSRDYTLKAGLLNHTSRPLSALTTSTPVSPATESSEISSSTSTKKTNEPPYLDERLFEARARVVGVESQPMTVEKKTKRRNRKVKTVKSKHKYTVLKVMGLRLRDLEELKRENGVVLLE